MNLPRCLSFANPLPGSSRDAGKRLARTLDKYNSAPARGQAAYDASSGSPRRTTTRRGRPHACPTRAATTRLLQTIAGVVLLSAATLVAFLPELGQLDRTAIAALVGVAPLSWERGRTERRRSIWGGRAPVRPVLYLAALAAIRHTPWLRRFCERLRAAGKPPKVAVTACMRTLLVVANALVRTGQPCDPARGHPTTPPA
uniref:IS110 family transposase n=2 Tax=Thermorudis TaxID=1649508 RepID=A0A831TEU7_9BACT